MFFFLLPQAKAIRMVIAQMFPFMDYGSVRINQTNRTKPSPQADPSNRVDHIKDDMCRSLFNALEYNNSLNRKKGEDNVQSRGDIRKKENPTQVY